jgi:uncharacterized protein
MMETRISVKEYFAALRENRLLGLKCQDCGFVTAPPRLACRKCSSQNSVVVELSGKGKIVTFTSVHIPPESRRGQAPYLVVMVELKEGPWILGNLEGVDPNRATLDLIDKKVTLKNRLPGDKTTKSNDIPPIFILGE